MDQNTVWEIAKPKAEITRAVECIANEIWTTFMKNFNSIL